MEIELKAGLIGEKVHDATENLFGADDGGGWCLRVEDEIVIEACVGFLEVCANGGRVKKIECTA